MKDKKEKSYICPFCKEEQTSVVSWENVSIAYEFNLETGESEEVDREGGDFESFACPSCGRDLPYRLYELIRRML